VCPLPAGTVTFLFTDVEGSTRLLDELGAERYAGAVGKATKKASPWVSTSTPPWLVNASRRMRRCSASAPA
jgi:hypothetical protein